MNWLANFFERTVLELFSKMNQGSLKLILPSGEIRAFGSPNGESEISAEIRILSPDFFKRCVLYGDIGFGESYMLGEWESPDAVKVIQWLIFNWESNPAISGSRTKTWILGCLKMLNRVLHLTRNNSKTGSLKNIRAHYDLKDELFQSFLDPTMTYSCADFSTGGKNLETAQLAKFERLAKTAQIKASDEVLEIGCGWGGFAIYLATTIGCRIHCITVSRNQYEWVKSKVSQLKLEDKIQVEFLDYRNLERRYDKIVSIEMMEAIGHRHLPDFFKKVEESLKPEGLVAVQVITCADSRYESLRKGVDWIQKYIFPGSLLPSIGGLTDAARMSSRFQMQSLHSLGQNYAITLKEWRSRFLNSLDQIKKMGFDETFIRTWMYYFCYCEAAFQMSHINVVQILYTRPNNIESHR